MGLDAQQQMGWVMVVCYWETGKKWQMNARWEAFSVEQFVAYGYDPQKCRKVLSIVPQ
jgi:hypothetical protein